MNNNKSIKLGNLSPTRDFTFVEDTADGFIMALKSNKIAGETINIGNNFEISIKEIIKIMQKEFGYNFKVVLDKKRVREKKSEVFRLIANNAKAKKLLNWKPRHAGINGFKLGLKKTIEWFKNPKNLKDYNSSLIQSKKLMKKISAKLIYILIKKTIGKGPIDYMSQVFPRLKLSILTKL